jgi:uncharacterized protein with PIN domain
MRFLCDLMVQKLGRILILSGFDTKIIKTNTEIKKLIEIAKLENRILITRNTKIEKFDFKNYILLKEQNPYNQFKYIIEKLKIKLNKENFFTRCSLCNEELIEIDKNLILDKIPPLTIKNTEKFYICPTCNKIYWKESHFDLFVNKIKNIVGYL